MKLLIDTSRVAFTVTRESQSKVDQGGNPRIDRESGKPMWSTQLIAVDSTGGEVIAVTTIGECPEVKTGEAVTVVHLVATPWHSAGKSGVSFRAEGIFRK